MTIKEFAKGIKALHTLPVAYIAIIFSTETKSYHLEVEESMTTISGVYDTQTNSLPQARQMAEELEKELAPIRVCQTRDEWENA